MINSELLDTILLEWSYRLKDGIPDVNDSAKVKVLNEILAEHKLPLYESGFNIEKISDPKYYKAWIDRIDKKMPFKIEGETTEFTIDPNSEFVKAFKNTKGKKDSLVRLFQFDGGTKYKNVIPGPDGGYPLSKISKDPFTKKVTSSGLTELNTPEAKEGLAAYFYLCSDSELDSVSQKIFLEKPDLQLKLDKSKAQEKYLGSKSKTIIDNVIDFLNTQTIDKDTHKTELNYFLNAFSAAYTMRNNWGDGYVIDRGQLFTDIRKLAKSLTGIPEDKWCPGDVYLYVDENKAKELYSETKTTKQLIAVKKGGKTINGLNTIFDSESPAAFAVSLKEEDALAGGATTFLNVEKVSSEDIGETTSRFSKEEKKIIEDIEYAEKENELIKGVNSLIDQYQKEHSDLITTLKTDIKSKGKIKDVVIIASTKTGKQTELSKNIQLYNLIKKNVGLRAMTDFFNNFDKMSRKLASKNPVIANYENPLAALTAFGVSLSGFNPTFYKVVANDDGTMGHIDTFNGRDTLEMLNDSVEIIDSPSKAGYQILYKTKMGEKLYQTTLDVRFKSKFEFTVTVEEFKEK